MIPSRSSCFSGVGAFPVAGGGVAGVRAWGLALRSRILHHSILRAIAGICSSFDADSTAVLCLTRFSLVNLYDSAGVAPSPLSRAYSSCRPAGRPVVKGWLASVGGAGGALVVVAGGGCVSAWGGCFGSGLLGGAVVSGGLGGASVGFVCWGGCGVVVAGWVCLFMVSAYHGWL